MQAKPKVRCRCTYCGKEKDLVPSWAKNFKYCSRRCKWAANKKVHKQKFTIHQYTAIKCANELCNKIIYILPCYSKNRGRRKEKKGYNRKHCSRACRLQVKSANYPILLAEFKKQQELEALKNVWRLTTQKTQPASPAQTNNDIDLKKRIWFIR